MNAKTQRRKDAKENESESRARAWWPAVLSSAVALAVFAVTLGGTFIYDDTVILTDVRYNHPAKWYQFWTDQYWLGGIDNLYRPLTCMTFAIQWELHGARAWPYHLVNILMHAGVAAGVAELGRRLFGTRAAWVAGVLFAIHPIHVEAVAGIVGRLELMCALPMVIAFCLFLKPMTRRRAWAIVACFLVAVLSKEQGVLLPALILALVPFRRQLLRLTPEELAAEKKAMVALGVSLCWMLAAYLIFRETILRFWWPRSSMYWTGNPLVRSTGVDHVLMPVVLLGRYMALFVAPIHLSLDYGTFVIGWTVNYHEPYLYIGLAAAAAWLALFVAAVVRRRWAMFFLLLGLALTYGMVSNSVSLIGTIFAERLMYLPSAFLMLIVGRLVAGAGEKWACAATSLEGKAESVGAVDCNDFKDVPHDGPYKNRTAKVGIAAPLVVAIALAGAWHSFTYARLWNNPAALFMKMLNEKPRSFQLHDLARQQLMGQGDYAAAREVGRRCVRDLPDIWDSYALCADVYIQTHDLAGAQQIVNEGNKLFHGADAIGWKNKVAELIAQQAGAKPAATQASH